MAGGRYRELSEAADTALNSKDRYDFSYKGWSFTTRQVKASKPCISCHAKRNGHEVREGDTIGVFLLGFRKHD